MANNRYERRAATAKARSSKRNDATHDEAVAHFLTPAIRFLRIDAVLDITGLSRSTLYDLIKSGQFPDNFNISEGTVAWLESEVVAWQRERLAARTARQGTGPAAANVVGTAEVHHER